MASDLDSLAEIYRIDSIFIGSLQWVGLIGNILMFAVFSVGRMREMSVSVYFQCLACTCALHNFYILVGYLPSLSILSNTSEILCQIKIFLFYYLKPTSAWFEVLAGLDRFLTIVYPYDFKLVKRPLGQTIIVSAVILLNAACYSSILIRSNVNLYVHEYLVRVHVCGRLESSQTHTRNLLEF